MPQQIFEQIYQSNSWGSSERPDSPYYSGLGSHGQIFVEPYVNKVIEFLTTLDDSVTVVDLGCGDFNIGCKIVEHTKSYIACDIVEDLIKFNARKFQSKNLEFRHLDAVKDELPQGDVVIIRQVLQHLSNSQIQSILTKVQRTYSYLLLTEELPNKSHFTENVDVSTGIGTRNHPDIMSGVVIERPPFNFPFKSKTVLSEALYKVYHHEGNVQTTLYVIK